MGSENPSSDINEPSGRFKMTDEYFNQSHNLDNLLTWYDKKALKNKRPLSVAGPGNNYCGCWYSFRSDLDAKT